MHITYFIQCSHNFHRNSRFMSIVFFLAFSIHKSFIMPIYKKRNIRRQKIVFVSQSLFPLDLKEHNGQSFMLLSRLSITLLCYLINPSLQMCVVTSKNKWHCGWTARKEWSRSASPLLLPPGEPLQWAIIRSLHSTRSPTGPLTGLSRQLPICLVSRDFWFLIG